MQAEKYLLILRSRCFGDKGDVEDITEGMVNISCKYASLIRQALIMETPKDDWLRSGWFEWNTDCFSAADIISTVEFDHTGNYLATGDKGGRVVLFERNESVSVSLSLWP